MPPTLIYSNLHTVIVDMVRTGSFAAFNINQQKKHFVTTAISVEP